MDIIQIVGLSLCTVLMMLILKQYSPEFAFLLSVAVSIIILLALISKVAVVVDAICEIASQADIRVLHLDTLLKIIAIAYIAEFGAQLCHDAHESALASKIELSAKIIIMVMAVPLVLLLLQTILQLMP